MTIFRRDLPSDTKYFQELRTKAGQGSFGVDTPFPTLFTELRLLELHGLGSQFFTELKKHFGLPSKDFLGRDFYWLSTSEDFKDSLFLINGLDFTFAWRASGIGESFDLANQIIQILKTLNYDFEINAAKRFERREISRMHLRVSKGYCTGEKCICTIGVDIDGK